MEKLSSETGPGLSAEAKRGEESRNSLARHTPYIAPTQLSHGPQLYTTLQLPFLGRAMQVLRSLCGLISYNELDVSPRRPLFGVVHLGG